MKREKRVETRVESGQSVEWLMIKNDSGIFVPWRRVLRFSADELRQWEEIHKNYKLSILQKFIMVISGPLLVCVGLTFWFFTHSILLGIAVFLALAYLQVKHYARMDKTYKQGRERLLMRYPNIPHNQVGTIDCWDAEYVVLSEDEYR